MSFIPLSDSTKDGVIINLDHFKEIKVDAKANTVSFGAGVLWRELAEPIHAAGRNLPIAIGGG